MQFDDRKFIELYNMPHTRQDIADYFNCSKSSVVRHELELGLRKTYNKKLSVEEIQDINNSYGIYSPYELANKYNIHFTTIYNIWRENGIIDHSSVIAEEKFNCNYFGTIDSPDKAYYIGLLASDGCVYHNEKYTDKSDNVILQLKDNDIDILKKFYDVVGKHEEPFHYSNRPVAQCMFCSNTMSNDLKKYGIVQRKTYDYKMVDLGKEYMGHYFRGYFDGDGTIYEMSCRNTLSRYIIKIAGFEHNLILMRDYLKTVGIHSVIYIDERKSKPNYPFGALAIKQAQSIYNFIKYIYTDHNGFCLERKKNKVNHYLSQMNSAYINKKPFNLSFLDDENKILQAV